MKERQRPFRIAGIAIVVAALATLAATPTLATPPTAKSYAVILVLIDPPTGELEIVPVCLQFTQTEMCEPDGNCGPWAFVEKARNENEWRASFDFVNDEGLAIHAELRGVTERAGIGNSIGGTVLYSIGEFLFNGSFSGARVSRSDCIAFSMIEGG